MVSIVDHAVVEFPTGPVGGYNPAIGQDGVIGLKSGFTDAAQICLVTAARRSVGGHSVLVVSSTLGQPSSLEWAAEIDLQLLDAATSDLRSRPLLRAYQPVARVVAGWSRERPVAVVTVPVTAVGWAGLPVRTVVKASIPLKPASGRGWRSGTPVAECGGADAGGCAVGDTCEAEPFPLLCSAWVDPPARGPALWPPLAAAESHGACPGSGVLGQSRPGF